MQVWGREGKMRGTKRFSLDLLLQGVQQPLYNLAFPANLETLRWVSRVLTNAVISLSTKCQPCFFHSWLWAVSIWGALISTPEPWEWWGPLWTMWWESLDWEEATTLCYSHWLLGVLWLGWDDKTWWHVSEKSMGPRTHLRLLIWFLVSMKEEKMKQASDKNRRKHAKKPNQTSPPSPVCVWLPLHKIILMYIIHALKD